MPARTYVFVTAANPDTNGILLHRLLTELGIAAVEVKVDEHVGVADDMPRRKAVVSIGAPHVFKYDVVLYEED